MDMEAAEEFVGSSNNDATLIAKGKRTKRHRPLSPAAVGAIVTNSTSSSDSGDGGAAVGGGGGGDYGSFSSTTTTYESTEEEEDMANCLILLAKGGDAHRHGEEHHHQGGKTERGGSRKFAEMATASASKIGFYIYECKTCNRTFPSFQALGGHRASHKKPKVAAEEKKVPLSPQLPPSPPLVTNYHELEDAGQLAHIIQNSPQISLQFGSNRSGLHNNNKAKIHECSICGSEFTSGQALGGHMRRHRASTSTSTQVVGMNVIDPSCNSTAAAAAVVEVRPRSILQLDLNLPAPEDDLRDTKYQFAPTQKSLVLSAPALVGCHY